MAFVRKGSSTSLGAGGGAALILALCARSMVGAGAVGSARVAFGESSVLRNRSLLQTLRASGCVYIFHGVPRTGVSRPGRKSGVDTVGLACAAADG